MIWPEVFQTGIIPDDMTKRQAIADILCAWGNCNASSKKSPADFGEVLISLREKFNIAVSQEGIFKEAEKIRNDNDTRRS